MADETSGRATHVGGKIKEGLGGLLGDGRMDKEGRLDQMQRRAEQDEAQAERQADEAAARRLAAQEAKRRSP